MDYPDFNPCEYCEGDPETCPCDPSDCMREMAAEHYEAMREMYE